MTVFIGIDGGGTKTAAVAADEDGNILGQAVAGSSNPEGQHLPSIQREFQSIKEQLAPVVHDWRDSVIFAGISGAAHAIKHEQIKTCLQAVYPDVTALTLDHDGMNALASVTYGDPGVIQIAGTGSLTFGVGETGDRCRVGGWGYLLGDEGSGFDLGRRALMHVMKAYDGRGPATALTDLALQKWDLSNPKDLIPHVYGDAVKSTIASFTYELFQAAQSRDRVAQTIIDEAAGDLAEAICTAIVKLGLSREKAPGTDTPSVANTTGDIERPAPSSAIPVGLIGGAFQPLMIEALRRKISQRLQPPPRLLRPSVEPVIGSLAWAYKGAGLDPKRLLNRGQK